MATHEKWVPKIRDWGLLGKSLGWVDAVPGSRVEQEILEYLRTGQLPAKVWRQGSWKPVDRTDWTLENLRARAADAIVDREGKYNWYHVYIPRFKELFPAARKLIDAPSTSSTPKQERKQESPIEHVMIRNILGRAEFKEKAPDYIGIAMRDLIKAIPKEAWKAECEKQNRTDLINQLPERYQIGRAIGRYKSR